QVRAGRATGGANGGNLFALPDQIALLHVERVGMGVTGLVTTGVADLDHVAVGATATGEGDHTGAHCVDRGTLRGGEVQARVHGDTPGNGVGAPAEAGGDVAGFHRGEVQGGIGVRLAVEHQLLQQLELLGT